MYDGKRKDLRPFITKLRVKLRMNADRYPTEENKVAYGMSRLTGRAARTADPFYRNGTLNTIGNFIALLEKTYDDASREHTAATKLENLRQRNREFTSFYSEFLGLAGELDWNETAKVAALRRAISDEIRNQLVGRDLPKTLPDFAQTCQRIDEDLRYNRQARSLKPSASHSKQTTKYDRPMRSQSPADDPMDIDTTRVRSYAPAGSQERKTRVTNGECFGCGQKGHIQKNCTIRPYEKVRRFSASSPRSLSSRSPPPRSSSSRASTNHDPSHASSRRGRSTRASPRPTKSKNRSS